MTELLIVISFTVAFFLLIFLIYNKEILGIYIIVIYMLSGTLNISGKFFKSIPFYNIKLIDSLMIILLMVSIIKSLKKINVINIILSSILVLNFISLCMGIYNGYELEKIMLEARQYIEFIIIVIYIYNCKTTKLNNFIKVMRNTAYFLVLIAIIRTILLSLGVNVYNDLDNRVLYATDVSLITIACIYAFYKNNKIEKMILLIAVIVLRHRTLWISTILAVVLWFIMDKKIKIKKIYIYGLISILILSINIYFSPNLDNKFVDSLRSSVNEMFAENSTFQWRIKSMEYLTSNEYMDGTINTLIGKSYGSGYERYQGGMYREEPAHDNYVEIFDRIGLIGLALQLSLYVIILKRSFEDKRLNINIAYIAMLLAYYIAYSGNLWQAILLGIILNHCFRKNYSISEG